MDIQPLIVQGESETLEFKASLQWDVRQSRQNEELRLSVLKTIAAFLNTRGGTLLVGVEDDGSVFGLEADLKLTRNSRDEFEKLFSDLLDKAIGSQYAALVKRTFETLEGKILYVVQVQPAPRAVYLEWKGKRSFYIRSGTTTRELDPKETHEYIENHWKSLPDHAPVSTTAPKGGFVAMQPFHTIAVPHDDIQQGRLTLDVFAADLWEVFQKRAPFEYQNGEEFFRKTYLTQGLKNLLEVVRNRLHGEGGDPVIQMQTPFGGGKTHALIALYHKASEWGVKTAVISGPALSSEDTLWATLARQLNVFDPLFDRLVSPGSEALRKMLAGNRPLLILMDEVLQYMIKAAGVKVGDTTLASQTLAFFQELYDSVASMDNVALVVTLPSSLIEHYDQTGERLFEQLQRILGRVQIVYTPVQENEVGAVIRQRLFSSVHADPAQKMVDAYVDYGIQEAFLISGEESVAYRERFLQTYPFLPEVIDVLYHRWGSFPSFQRTRGVLRLLALVVSSLKNASIPYISLADFDLSIDTIRHELLNHIGNEYDSVLAADITSQNAGAQKADREIGRSYQGLNMGRRAATTIFMYSHLGGGGEAGATLSEIKRHAAIIGQPSSIVSDVLELLSNRLLFYLHEQGKRYYFSTTANLNRAMNIRMENLTAQDLRNAEKDLLGAVVEGKRFRTYLWPESPAEVPDTPDPKLIVLYEADPANIQRFLDEKGENPRVNRNTLFFLSALPGERIAFEMLLRRYLAMESLLNDATLLLSEAQGQELRKQAHKMKADLQDHIRRLYRQLFLPKRGDVAEQDMGIPTYGSGRKLDEEVYEWLRNNGRLVEKIAPLVIKERYLHDKDFVRTQQLLESSWRTPGEIFVKNRSVWESGIAEGVRSGMFGLGELDENERPRCLYFKNEPSISLEGREVLIRAEICEEQQRMQNAASGGITFQHTSSTQQGIGEPQPGATMTNPTIPAPSWQEPQPVSHESSTLRLKFQLTGGKLSNIYNLLGFLQKKFNRMDFEITFSEGSISEDEIRNKIEETFHQLGIDGQIEKH
jgi:hypothetical protein